MIAKYPVFYIARLVLETTAPLSISTGRGDGIYDNLLVRDANSLPAIPGSSFAGVLRHVYEANNGKPAADQLFGKGAEKGDSQEWPSWVQISWGYLHNSQDKPVESLPLFDKQESYEKHEECLQKDEVLQDALTSMITRDHVRMTHRGAADVEAKGKFDRSSLRAGHRFSIELSLWSEKINPEWENLLNLLNSPAFRLGGATRRGLGKIKVARIHQGRFILEKQDEYQKYCDLTASLADVNGLVKYPPTDNIQAKQKTNKIIPKRYQDKKDNNKDIDNGKSDSPKKENWIHADLMLLPKEPYRFGGGHQPLNPKSEADDYPVLEQKVTWDSGNKGKLDSTLYLLIPGSSVKGAISHRTVFHYNILTGKFADTLKDDEKPLDYLGEHNEAIKALFGYAKNDEEDKKDKGHAGYVLFDDAYLKIAQNQTQDIIHNSIDRFTGGVRNQILFTEEVVNDKQQLKLTLTILQPNQASAEARKALQRALADLCEGRLALGAGSGRGGLGYFSGTCKWSDDGNWIKGENGNAG